MNTYKEYFNAERANLDSVCALEIGADDAPVLDNLEECGKSFVYRGINHPSDIINYWKYADKYDWDLPEHEKPENRPDTHNPLWYRAFAKDRLKNNPKKVIVPWDAGDLPLPFENGFFTEVHCHMILGNIVRSNDSEGCDLPTTKQFVEEISRITKPGGIAFLSIQDSLFFDYMSTKKRFPDLTKELEDEFRQLNYDWEGTFDGLYDFSRDWLHSDYTILRKKSS
jgi:hypothetical protein